MATRVEMPVLGQSMEEGTVTRWFKQEGDSVRQGETLFEVMTDKANIEQDAPASGILRKIVVAENESVPVNTLIAVIAATADEPIEQLISGNGNVADVTTPVAGESSSNGATVASSAPSVEPNGARIFASPRARRVAGELGIGIADLAGKGTGIDGRVVEADVLAYFQSLQIDQKSSRITPLARALASEHGIDLTGIDGSGALGKVTKDDVRRTLAPSSAPVSAPTPASGDRVIALAGMRKMIADNVARSAQTAPHVTLTIGVDMAEATRFRSAVLPSVEKTHGLRITFTDIIVKAVARALQDHPMLNSTLSDGAITLHQAVHMGVAVSLGEAGLVVPVIRDAHVKGLPQISKEIKEMAARAKEGRLTGDEMAGGTFTISNLGASGIESFTPIINPPQCAILGVCAIKDQPVVVNKVVEVRPVMNLSLSFDHRITDGAPAAYFLARVKEVLEQPYLMFA